MPKKSAGILVYKFVQDVPQVFLVHPGGPLWTNKEEGVWSVPKGEFLEDEQPLEAAKREFLEETGQSIDGDFIELQPVRQSSHKTVFPFAVQGYVSENITSNTFEMEWPLHSGNVETYPEVDRAGWFSIEEAKIKILKGQKPILDDLVAFLSFSKQAN
jgi:predicted NUDIX family NTP pyrophosphohydrolase